MLNAKARLLPLRSAALPPLPLSLSGVQTKMPPPPLSSWKARGPSPKVRGCFQVTTRCHCENVSKRQRRLHASSKPRLPRPSVGHRLKHPWAVAWLQVKTITRERRGWTEHRRLRLRRLCDSTQRFQSKRQILELRSRQPDSWLLPHIPRILTLIKSQTLLNQPACVNIFVCMCTSILLTSPGRNPIKSLPCTKSHRGMCQGWWSWCRIKKKNSKWTQIQLKRVNDW